MEEWTIHSEEQLVKDYILQKIKEYKPQAIRFGLVVALLVVGKSTTTFLKWHDNNILEEYIEKIIYHKTGVLIELTPEADESFIQKVDEQKFREHLKFVKETDDKN